MTTWDAWLPDVLPHVRGCPRRVAEHEIKRAAQLLLERSRAWIVRTPEIAVTADVPDVTLTLGDATRDLVRIERAWFDGLPLTPRTAGELTDLAGLDWRDQTGAPDSLVQVSPGAVRLYPTPVADGTFDAECSVKPGESATGVPDDIAAAHRMIIATGAKGALMLMPRVDWHDLKLGGALLQGFERAINAAVADAARGHGRAMRRPSVAWC